MRTLYTACLLIMISAALPGQSPYCTNDGLFLSPQNQEIDSITVKYKTAPSIDEWTIPFFDDLYMRIYWPKLAPGEKRPLALFIHGGAFIVGGHEAFIPQARYLATLGYVTATIDYRLCKRNNCLLASNEDIAPLILCFMNFGSDFVQPAYVAAIDAFDAIRYLQTNAETYHIDPDYVIVGGHSAGAWTALHLGFLDQEEINAIYPGLEGTWGPLNPVEGIKGVFSISGALLDSNWIDPDETTPVFYYHGTCDAVAHYEQEPPFQCSQYPAVYGAEPLAERMADLGHDYYLLTATQMGHDPSPAYEIFTCQALQFLKQTALCGNSVNQHSLVEVQPPSAECSFLDNPATPSGLALSPLWDDAPCQPVSAVFAQEKPLAWKAFPNPAQDAIFLKLEGITDHPAGLYLPDGRQVANWNLEPGENRLELPAGLTAGLYFLKVGHQAQAIAIH